jgi:hypothetical protein
MKKTLLLLAVLSVISLTLANAQQGTQIKVKGSDVITGVVIVDILKDGKPFELHCNQGPSNCKTLKGGTYWMVQLLPNFGMYDCQNVEVYRLDNDTPSSEPIGEYCLIKK